MSDYSPQAKELLARWNCLSANMHSVLARARYLQRKASDMGVAVEQDLARQLAQTEATFLYRRVGREMRRLTSQEGVEKEFPEAGEFQGRFTTGRFVDFHISEEAIPGMLDQIDQVNLLVLRLLAILCFAVRLDPDAELPE